MAIDVAGTYKHPDSKVYRATWGPPGDNRTQVGPMLALWTLLSGQTYMNLRRQTGIVYLPNSQAHCHDNDKFDGDYFFKI